MSVKKLLVILLSVCLAVVALDVALNRLLTGYVRTHAFPGDYEKIHYVLQQCDEELLLIGASQCSASFVTELFEERLGMRTFNCGLNSQTVELFDVILDSAVRRHPPRTAVVVLRPVDLNSTATGRLSMLNIYYGSYSKLLDHYLEGDSLFSRLQLRSSLLRINTHWWRILLYHFISFNEMGHKGFIPKPVRELHPTQLLPFAEHRLLTDTQIVPEKLAVLNHLVQIARAHNIRLIFLFPPEMTDYSRTGNPYKRMMEEYCCEQGLTFIYNTELPEILDHREYFYDEHHLNEDGARAYTKLFLDRYGDLLKAK